jgi:hypothetical protein
MIKFTHLNIDERPHSQPAGSYRFGKNGVLDYVKKAIINELGFFARITAPFTPIGVIETDKYPVIFSTNNTDSAIGYFDTDTNQYQPIVNDTTLPFKLGFKLNDFITGQFQRNYLGQTIVVFRGNEIIPMYLNCDNPVATTLNDLRLFPNALLPQLTGSVQTGGNIPVGSHYFAIKYLGKDGIETSFLTLSSPFVVTSTTNVGISDKQIQLNITNLDTAYEKIQVAVISKINGIVSQYLLPESDVSGSNHTIIFTGNEVTSAITLEEILIPPVSYERVGTIGQLNDALYLGDVKASENVVLQQYANLIRLKWKSDLVTIVPDTDADTITFMHDEVYAFYVRYLLANGKKTKAFTIPGLNLTTPERQSSIIAAIEGLDGSVYQYENTVANVNVPNRTGEMGKWENKNETYPNKPEFDSTNLSAYGGSDLRGQKVRHHRTPSIRFCKDTLYPSDATYGVTKLDKLSVVPENVLIPSNLNGTIIGYEILFAKRNQTNSVVNGQSLLLFGGTETGSIGNVYYSTGGNWNSFYGGFPSQSLNQKIVHLHAFDVLFNKPALSPTHLSLQLKLKHTGANLMNSPDQDGAETGPNVRLFDYALQGTADTNITGVGGTTRTIKKIVNSTYVPNHLRFGKWDNERTETFFGAEMAVVESLILNSDISAINGFSAGGGVGWNQPNKETTFLTNIVSMKNDAYFPFYGQTLVRSGTGTIAAGVGNAIICKGDSFLNSYTFHTYGRHGINSGSAEVEGQQYYAGVKVARRFICESAANLRGRYEDAGNVHSKFYPKSTLTLGAPDNYLRQFFRNIDPNQFGYSKDFNALDDLFEAVVYTGSEIDVYEFPYRVHRGGKLQKQTKPRNWRTFLPLDYYESKKNLGRIMHLEGIQDRLLIHHEKGLLVTQDKAKLESNILSITLGTGDIFQFEPQDAQASKLGYAGTQHKLACHRNPFGYFFIDSQAGQIFQWNGKDLKLLNGDLNTLFQEYFRTLGTNTYIGNGYVMGYDPMYKRLMLTKKFNVDGTDESLTLSYSLLSEQWVMFHDYTPDMYLSTREKLYSIKLTNVYEHNVGTYGVYYSVPAKSFFIDAVFNNEEEMTLNTIAWLTEVLNNNQDLEFSTFTHITVWNSFQCTGRIPVNIIFADLEFRNTRKLQSEWSFNEFRDLVVTRGTTFLLDIFNNYSVNNSAISVNKPWFEKDLLEGKYFIIRFEFDNAVNKQFIFHGAEIDASKSYR